MAGLLFLVLWVESLIGPASGWGDDGHQDEEAHGHKPGGSHPTSLALSPPGAKNPLTPFARGGGPLRSMCGGEVAVCQEGEAHGHTPLEPPPELNSLAQPRTGIPRPLTAY